MDPIAIAQLVLKAAGEIGPQVAAAVPGKAERLYRQQAFKDKEALDRSMGSGFTSSQRQAFRAEGSGQTQARTQQALAQLARGSAQGGGESGQAQAGTRDVYRLAAAEGNQMESGIRAGDLAAGMQKRAANDQALLTAYEMGQARKKAALAATASGGGAYGEMVGQGARIAKAGKIAKETDALEFGSAADLMTIEGG